ncbi:helix-turn-helix domain-containing protein [Micromonospora sp. NPDC005163]
MLEAVGLDAPEGRIYRFLVRLPSASPEDLAEQLRMLPAEVTNHLHAMERKGLVNRVPARRGRFRATPPELAFGPLLGQRQQELESIQSAIGQLSEEYRSQAARHDANELIEVVYGREAVAHRFDQLQLSATHEVLGLLREPMQAVPPTETAASQTALDAGVDYRVVYDAALLELPGDPYEIGPSLRRGERARAAIGLPVKMVLVDRRSAIIPLSPLPSPDEPSAIIVHPSGLLDALAALFEQIWATATPLAVGADGPVPAAGSATVPSPQDRQLLSLLLAGLTDQAIAAQLGTSMRTVQRRIHGLTERAGVRTRLQLVWQAAHRGWL